MIKEIDNRISHIKKILLKKGTKTFWGKLWNRRLKKWEELRGKFYQLYNK